MWGLIKQVTLDGGKSWNRLVEKGSHFGAYLHPQKPDWIYMTLCEGSHDQSGLWLSKDKGETWMPFENIPHKWIQRVGFDPEDEDIIYVSSFGCSSIRLPADPENFKKLETPY